MYRHADTKKFLAKMINWHWMPESPAGRINLAEDSHGTFNLYWLMAGKPSIDEMRNNIELKTWLKACQLSCRMVKKEKVEYVATTKTEAEFIQWAAKNLPKEDNLLLKQALAKGVA